MRFDNTDGVDKTDQPVQPKFVHINKCSLTQSDRTLYRRRRHESAVKTMGSRRPRGVHQPAGES